MLKSIQEGMTSDSYLSLTDHIVFTSEHKSKPYLPNSLSTTVEETSNDSVIIVITVLIILVAIITIALIVKRQRVVSWFRNVMRREVNEESRDEKKEAIAETTVDQTAHISVAEQETWQDDSHPSEDIYDDESGESFDDWESKGNNDGSGDVISAVPFDTLPSGQIDQDACELEGEKDLEQLKANRGEQLHQQNESERDSENEHPPRELNMENAENDVNMQIDDHETRSLSENGGVNFVLVNNSTDSLDN